eukprot:EG_transcript_19102
MRAILWILILLIWHISAYCGNKAYNFGAVDPITFTAVERRGQQHVGGEKFTWQIAFCSRRANLCRGAHSIIEQRRGNGGSCTDLSRFMEFPAFSFGRSEGTEFVTFMYSSGIGGSREANVRITCNKELDPNEVIVKPTGNPNESPFYYAIEKLPSIYYDFFLESRCACAGGCTGRRYGWGWKVLLALGLLAAAYFGGGGYYNRRYRGLAGMEAVPNVAFWKDLPFLVLDGAKFAATGVRWAWERGVERWRGAGYSAFLAG